MLQVARIDQINEWHRVFSFLISYRTVGKDQKIKILEECFILSRGSKNYEQEFLWKEIFHITKFNKKSNSQPASEIIDHLLNTYIITAILIEAGPACKQLPFKTAMTKKSKA